MSNSSDLPFQIVFPPRFWVLHAWLNWLSLIRPLSASVVHLLLDCPRPPDPALINPSSLSITSSKNPRETRVLELLFSWEKAPTGIKSCYLYVFLQFKWISSLLSKNYHAHGFYKKLDVWLLPSVVNWYREGSIIFTFLLISERINSGVARMSKVTTYLNILVQMKEKMWRLLVWLRYCLLRPIIWVSRLFVIILKEHANLSSELLFGSVSLSNSLNN